MGRRIYVCIRWGLLGYKFVGKITARILLVSMWLDIISYKRQPLHYDPAFERSCCRFCFLSYLNLWQFRQQCAFRTVQQWKPPHRMFESGQFVWDFCLVRLSASPTFFLCTRVCLSIFVCLYNCVCSCTGVLSFVFGTVDCIPHAHTKRARTQPYLQVLKAETRVGGLPPAAGHVFFCQKVCWGHSRAHGGWLRTIMDFTICWSWQSLWGARLVWKSATPMFKTYDL